MRLKVLYLAKVKESSVREIILLYQKRIKKYIPFSWEECSETSFAKILEQDKPNQCVVLLDKKGRATNSEQFALFLQEKILQHDVIFAIGGAEGFTQEQLKLADASLSFGPMTFGNQIAQIVLAEQLYRAFTIIHKEPYHK